jgi:hypothetical protein
MNITIGSKVQYKKVGKAIVTEILQDKETSAQVKLSFLTGPKDYKTGGRLADSLFWIGESDILELAEISEPEPQEPETVGSIFVPMAMPEVHAALEAVNTDAPKVEGPVTFESTGYGTVVLLRGKRFTTIYSKPNGSCRAKVRGMACTWPSLEIAATELVELARQ